MKLAYTLAFLGIILIASWFGLDNWLEPRALAVLNGEKFTGEAEGWAIVTASWPLLVSFGLILAVVFTVIFGVFVEIAQKADFKAEIAELRERVENSEKNAQRAREELLKAQEQANDAAKKSVDYAIQQANHKTQQAEALSAQARQTIQEAKAERDQMAICLLESDSKRQKAEAFTIRFKRKAARVEEKLWAFLESRFNFNDDYDEWKGQVQQIFEPITKQTDKTMMKPNREQSPCMEIARGLGQSPR